MNANKATAGYKMNANKATDEIEIVHKYASHLSTQSFKFDLTKAQKMATEGCKSWGKVSAKPISKPALRCRSLSSTAGVCMMKQVTAKYKCEG